jgi:ubiquinol-cytochrome c reductase cytochrome b subunit
VLGDLAIRFAQIYFLFFFVLWIHSRTRSALYSISWFIALIGAVTFYDVLRSTQDTAGLIAMTWLIPASYLSIMLLLPLCTSLGQDKAVPQELRQPSS